MAGQKRRGDLQKPDQPVDGEGKARSELGCTAQGGPQRAAPARGLETSGETGWAMPPGEQRTGGEVMAVRAWLKQGQFSRRLQSPGEPSSRMSKNSHHTDAR